MRVRRSTRARLRQVHHRRLPLRAQLLDGLTRYLDDDRIEIDTNAAVRGMRPIALNRKNALFAGHDASAASWACLASLIETAKFNGVDPQPWLAETLEMRVNL